MKKTLVILLLSLVLLKIGGLVGILCVEREIMRESRFEQIDDNTISKDLTCIVGNDAKIEWEEENKEFWYDGKLYDILKIKIKNGLPHYYCLADDDETELVTVIKNLIETNGSPLSQTTKNIIGWFFQWVIVPEIEQVKFANYYYFVSPKSFFQPANYVFESWFKIIKPPITRIVKCCF